MSLLIAQGVGFPVYGDGTSTTFTVDLTDPPINMDFKGNSPVAVVEATTGVTVSINGSKLTLEYATAPPIGSVGFGAVLLFPGV